MRLPLGFALLAMRGARGRAGAYLLFLSRGRAFRREGGEAEAAGCSAAALPGAGAGARAIALLSAASVSAEAAVEAVRVAAPAAAVGAARRARQELKNSFQVCPLSSLASLAASYCALQSRKTLKPHAEAWLVAPVAAHTTTTVAAVVDKRDRIDMTASTFLRGLRSRA